MATKKHNELMIFLNEATAYRYVEDEKGIAIKDPPVRHRLDRALDKLVIQLPKAIAANKCEEIYNDRLREIPLEHCVIDTATKAFKMNEKGDYLQTPDDGKQVIIKQRAALSNLNNAQIEFEPHIINDDDVPKLSERQAAAFRGFVISETYEIPEPKWDSNGGTADQAKEEKQPQQ